MDTSIVWLSCGRVVWEARRSDKAPQTLGGECEGMWRKCQAESTVYDHKANDLGMPYVLVGQGVQGGQ